MKTPRPHQRDAIRKISNGNVVVGATGSGKSLVGLVYYYTNILEGSVEPFRKPTKSVSLYIITTATKRDSLDWNSECAEFALSTNQEASVNGIKVVIDSWNNIKKYKDIRGGFFLFDEQKTTGYKRWSKIFIRIAKNNRWILITATPSDRWMDLLSVFIANGFYKNKRDFVNQHVTYNPYVKYPSITGYRNVNKLRILKKRIFVIIDYQSPSIIENKVISVDYDVDALTQIEKTEWNPFTDSPIINLSEFASVLRRSLNSHPSRINEAIRIRNTVKKLIVFYNFNFELEILKHGYSGIKIGELNGHRHDALPVGSDWVYLVQYNSGNEAWECFTTNHMLFYSLNYSFRIMTQAKGRINRLTSGFNYMYYYYLVSNHWLDKGIQKALNKKRDFNNKEILGLNKRIT